MAQAYIFTSNSFRHAGFLHFTHIPVALAFWVRQTEAFLPQ